MTTAQMSEDVKRPIGQDTRDWSARLPHPGKVLATAAAYYVLARLGVELGIPPDGIAVFWPPNAIILCTLLMVPFGQWWGYIAGFIAAEVVGDVPVFSVTEAILFGLVNCFEGSLSAFVLRCLVAERFDLSTGRQLKYFVLVAVVGVPCIAAVAGGAVYVMGGSEKTLAVLWRTWWLGDAVGLAALAPLILTVWRYVEDDVEATRPSYWIELAVSLAVLAATTILAFNLDWLIGADYYQLFYVYPVLAWIALRGKVLGAAAAGAVMAATVSWLAVSGGIPVGVSGRFADVFFLQQFLAVTSLSTLTLAVLVAETAALNRRLGVALERTRLENEILEAKERAEEASEAKTRFLAHVSHELRTPLNAISGFAGSIRNKTFGPVGDPHYEEYAARIEDASAHLLAVINDLIDVSSVEAGNIRLSEEAVAPGPLIDEILRMLEASAAEKDARLCNLSPPGLPRLQCDETRLRQMLLNLVGNAVKFSFRGGRVEVRADYDGRRLSLQVRDYGEGIPHDKLADAFERYQQFSSDPHVRAKGSGLGLHVTRLLMQAHGGDVSLQSAPGEGTTATLLFPAARVLPP